MTHESAGAYALASESALEAAPLNDSAIDTAETETTDNAAEAVESGFASFGLRPSLLKNIERLGWHTPSDIQAEVIPLALEGHDLFGIAQTGTGKTAAFALPVIERLAELPPARQLEPHCLVIAPTRELVAQIEEQFSILSRGSRIRTATVYGGVSERPQIQAMRNGVEILVAAPGRLLDLINQGWINLSAVKYLVLDEADRMFDMGFIRDIRKIIAMTPRDKQTLLLSATMPPEIRQLAEDFLHNPKEVKIGISAPPAELTHELWRMHGEQKLDALQGLLEEDLDSVIVFCRTRSRADSVQRKLERAGEACAALHSSRSQAQRDKALAQFKAGQIRTLVATDVASRGIDVQGVQLIVNFDVPMVPEDYVHRVGRTARAKRSGRAVTFAAREEEKYVQRIEKLLGHRINGPEGKPAQGAEPPMRVSKAEPPATPRKRSRPSESPVMAEPRRRSEQPPARSERQPRPDRAAPRGRSNDAPVRQPQQQRMPDSFRGNDGDYYEEKPFSFAAMDTSRDDRNRPAADRNGRPSAAPATARPAAKGPTFADGNNRPRGGRGGRNARGSYGSSGSSDRGGRSR